MANTRSAIKRMRQNPKRRQRNRLFKGKARSFVRDARAAIKSEDLEEARTAGMMAVSALDNRSP